MPRYLINESCPKSGSQCSHAQDNVIISAVSLEEAKEKALNAGNGYFPFDPDYDWEHIHKSRDGHTLTVSELSDEHKVDLNNYLTESLAKYRLSKEKKKEEADRQLFESLKVRFGSSDKTSEIA